jgi:hypothetical protein
VCVASGVFWWGLVQFGQVCVGVWHPKFFEYFSLIGRVGGRSGICEYFSLLTAPSQFVFKSGINEYFCFPHQFVNSGTNM